MTEQNLTTIVTSTELDILILSWLKASARSGSAKTRTAYETTIYQFRAGLQRQGLDLDSQDAPALARIALTAQAFAGYSARTDKKTGERKEATPATKNQRLAIISSFYEHAILQASLPITVNPIDRVKRMKVQPYQGARALEAKNVAERLAAINRDELAGKRDYALLALLIETGHRLTVVTTLEARHLDLQHGKIRATFEHCKGDETLVVTLSYATSNALLEWLRAWYGADFKPGTPSDTRPVWIALTHDRRSYGKPLGPQSVAAICEKWLDTRKVHTTRHTFAYNLEKLGVPASEIQKRLGHKSLATTGRYLAHLTQAETTYADKLADELGIK